MTTYLENLASNFSYGFSGALDMPGGTMGDYRLDLNNPAETDIFNLNPESYGNNPNVKLPEAGTNSNGGFLSNFFGGLLNTATQTANNAAQIVSNSWLYNLAQNNPVGPASTQNQSPIAETGQTFLDRSGTNTTSKIDPKVFYVGGGLAILTAIYVVAKK